MPNIEKVDANGFYSEWHGHLVQDLKVLYPPLRASCDSLIWTAGDSSLDNKYWFHASRPAVGVYADVLEPPTCNADVTYWLNYLAADDERRKGGGSTRLAAINTAVEATTLNERTRRLRPQDIFLRDNIKENDVLIVSVGGNDIALAPLPCTIVSVASLVCLPTFCIENACVGGTVPVDDCCCGCGASLLSCSCAFPPCFGYVVHLFGVRVQKYIEKLTSKTKPRKILVCMIYYPDENRAPSWAGAALGALNYNSNPQKVQLVIRKMFEAATSSIQIPGTEVIPIPLFNPLDGKNSHDYVARVEPSAQGGRKMAEYLLDAIEGSHTTAYGSAPLSPFGQPPSQAPFMVDR